MNKHNNNNNTAVAHSETLSAAIQDLVQLLAEEETYYIGKETGRQLRWGELDALGVLEDVPAEFQIVDAPGVDIFGQPLAKKYNFECECPRCHRTLAAARFAPHLEKCMGMGRNSSRIASRRLAATGTATNSNNNNNNNNNNGNGSNSSSGNDSTKGVSQGNNVASSGQSQNGELPSEDEHFEEDEDDEDWTMERKRKNTKKAVEKISPKRKGPINRVKNVDGVGTRGKRGGSPSVTDSPSSIAESSLHGDEDFSSMTLG